MPDQFHILNGDCLYDQLKDQVPGHLIVMRECLIDGAAEGDDPEVFFKTRASFIKNRYGMPEAAYYRKTVNELIRIKDIPRSAEINLWFEDDLFCQANLWFILHLLTQYAVLSPVYLVRPEVHDQYGFSSLPADRLRALLHKRTELTDKKQMARLWQHYHRQEHSKLHELAVDLHSHYPFLLPAVQAHLDRYPEEGSDHGRPQRTLLQIMDDIGTDDFASVFREFSRRESIYGFGDLQVKAMMEGLRER